MYSLLQPTSFKLFHGGIFTSMTEGNRDNILSTLTPTGRWKLAWRTLKSYIIVLCSLRSLTFNWLHRTNHQLALTTQWNKLSIHAVSLSLVLELAADQIVKVSAAFSALRVKIKRFLQHWTSGSFSYPEDQFYFFHKMFLNECRSKNILEWVLHICIVSGGVT